MSVTPEGLQELLGADSKQLDQVMSCEVVVPEKIKEVLGEGERVARDPYFLRERLESSHMARRGDPYGTGGNHVGRDLSNKFQPDALDKEGPNPHGDRRFFGKEFQGMLMFAPDGKPAFWRDGTPPELLTINIATKVPPYATDPNGRLEPFLRGREQSAFGGQKFESALEAVDERVIAQVQSYAERFERTTGIKMNVVFDQPDEDTHISVMAFRNGSRSLNGFATFPKRMQGWQALEKYGHTPGIMCLNADNMDRYSDKLIHDLFAHEFGHSIGWAHPHDLAEFAGISREEAMELTTMAYTDLYYRPFDGMEGAEFGIMDYGVRKWVGNAPELNPGNLTYDLEAQHRLTLEDNKDTMTYRTKKLLPATPIMAHGENNELRGSMGDDFIDTNPGYGCQIKHPETGAKQKFAMVEGHLARVLGIQGNNTIIAAQHHDQHIEPGIGTNEVRMVYPDLSGEKTLKCDGTDTLVVTTDLIGNAKTLTTEQDGDDLILQINEGAASIRLSGQAKGQGITTFRLVDGKGNQVFEANAKDLNRDDFHHTITRRALAETALLELDAKGQTPWTRRLTQQVESETSQGRAA